MRGEAFSCKRHYFSKMARQFPRPKPTLGDYMTSPPAAITRTRMIAMNVDKDVLNLYDEVRELI